jgi:uncharacterized repeat protein (TIGR01451 family)
LTEINEVDSNSENNSAMAMLTPDSVDLQVTKSVNNSTPFVGEQVEFSINAKNNGPSTATGVVFQDVLPPGLTLVSSDATAGSFNATTGDWSVGTLANGADANLTLQTSVDTLGTKVNQVVLSEVNETDTVASNNSSQVQVVPRSNDLNLTVLKVVDNATPNLGEVVTFSVSVENQGDITATNVQVDDKLPSGISFVSSAVSQGTYDAGTGVWNVGTLVSTEQAQLTLDGRVTSTEQQTNRASLDTSVLDQNDTDPSDNVAAAMLTAQTPEVFGKRRFLASSFE